MSKIATMAVAGQERPPQHHGRGLASVREAEAFLSLSRSSLYSMMDRGELAYVKLGKSRRIPWDALDELVQKNMKTS